MSETISIPTRIAFGRYFFLYSLQFGRAGTPIIRTNPLMLTLCPDSKTISLEFLSDIHFHTFSIGEGQPIRIGIFSLDVDCSKEFPKVFALAKEKRTMEFELAGYQHIGLYEIRDYTVDVDGYHNLPGSPIWGAEGCSDPCGGVVIQNHPGIPLSEDGRGFPPATFSLYYRRLAEEKVRDNIIYRGLAKKFQCDIYYVSNPSILLPTSFFE